MKKIQFAILITVIGIGFQIMSETPEVFLIASILGLIMGIWGMVEKNQ